LSQIQVLARGRNFTTDCLFYEVLDRERDILGDSGFETAART